MERLWGIERGTPRSPGEIGLGWVKYEELVYVQVSYSQVDLITKQTDEKIINCSSTEKNPTHVLISDFLSIYSPKSPVTLTNPFNPFIHSSLSPRFFFFFFFNIPSQTESKKPNSLKNSISLHLFLHFFYLLFFFIYLSLHCTSSHRISSFLHSSFLIPHFLIFSSPHPTPHPTRQ